MTEDAPATGARTNRRIVLKFSGEALMGSQQFGIEPAIVNRLACDIKDIHNEQIEAAVVIGGGNIWRGLSASTQGMDRAQADYMGILATVLNALAIQDALERVGVQTRVQTAIDMHQIAEPYIRRRAIRHLEKGRVVIMAGGTGNPYFTTDTAAALRAAEISADCILMAKNGVDGVYSADPRRCPDAEKFDRIGYQEFIERDLRIIDAAAISLSRDNNIPIIVFDVDRDGNIQRAARGENVGTLICD